MSLVFLVSLVCFGAIRVICVFGFCFFGMVGVMPGKMLLAQLVAMAVCVLVFTQMFSKEFANVSLPSSNTVAKLSDVNSSMVLNKIEKTIFLVGEEKDDKITILKNISELTGLVNEIKSRQADMVSKNESTTHLHVVEHAPETDALWHSFAKHFLDSCHFGRNSSMSVKTQDGGRASPAYPYLEETCLNRRHDMTIGMIQATECNTVLEIGAYLSPLIKTDETVWKHTYGNSRSASKVPQYYISVDPSAPACDFYNRTIETNLVQILEMPVLFDVFWEVLHSKLEALVQKHKLCVVWLGFSATDFPDRGSALFREKSDFFGVLDESNAAAMRKVMELSELVVLEAPGSHCSPKPAERCPHHCCGPEWGVRYFKDSVANRTFYEHAAQQQNLLDSEKVNKGLFGYKNHWKVLDQCFVNVENVGCAVLECGGDVKHPPQSGQYSIPQVTRQLVAFQQPHKADIRKLLPACDGTEFPAKHQSDCQVHGSPEEFGEQIYECRGFKASKGSPEPEAWQDLSSQKSFCKDSLPGNTTFIQGPLSGCPHTPFGSEDTLTQLTQICSEGSSSFDLNHLCRHMLTCSSAWNLHNSFNWRNKSQDALPGIVAQLHQSFSKYTTHAENIVELPQCLQFPKRLSHMCKGGLKQYIPFVDKLEPLYTDLRNMMYHEAGALIDFTAYLPLPGMKGFDPLPPTRRKVLIVAGANEFCRAPKYLLDMYSPYFEFDDVYIFDAHEVSIPAAFNTSRMHVETTYLQIGTNNEKDLVSLLPSLVLEQDYVVLMWDTDFSSSGVTLEWGFLASLLSMERRLVDELYTELHFVHPKLNWLYDRHSGAEAFEMLHQLRHGCGFIVHAWP